jgi:hypothetical protein
MIVGECTHVSDHSTSDQRIVSGSDHLTVNQKLDRDHECAGSIGVRWPLAVQDAAMQKPSFDCELEPSRQRCDRSGIKRENKEGKSIDQAT